MRLLTLLCLFALTGCWTGGPFYQLSDARPALPAGDYIMGRPSLPGEPPQEGAGRVTILPDGMTRIADTSAAEPRDILTLGFIPFGADGRFVAWITRYDNHDLSDANAAYGVLMRAEDGAYRLHMPGCGDPMERVAQAAGATIERSQNGLKLCRFRDRASLEAALGSFITQPPDDVLILTFRPRG